MSDDVTSDIFSLDSKFETFGVVSLNCWLDTSVDVRLDKRSLDR